nr:MAG TPA: Mitotic-spindle organizing gamma-tubulin ring associated [Crassvirales sp.]
MKTTHTLSAIEAVAYALEHSKEIPDVSFSKVKPNVTTHQALKDIQKMSIDLSIELKNKLEQVLKLMKAEGKTKDDKAFKIIVDLLY